jgi:hypothetical protein
MDSRTRRGGKASEFHNVTSPGDCIAPTAVSLFSLQKIIPTQSHSFNVSLTSALAPCSCL